MMLVHRRSVVLAFVGVCGAAGGMGGFAHAAVAAVSAPPAASAPPPIDPPSPRLTFSEPAPAEQGGVSQSPGPSALLANWSPSLHLSFLQPEGTDAAGKLGPDGKPEPLPEATPAEDHGGGGLSAEELARKAQNPVADMISLPFQNNIGFNVGPTNGTQNVLNIQPVIPFSLGEEWNLITRTIVPIVYQPSPAEGIDHEFGLGDIQFTAFFSPAKSEGLIWGLGPVAVFPTATNDILGQGKWSLGPSAVALCITGHWVFGALIQNVWSVAGDSDRARVNQMLLQPFVNYNMAGGWYLTTSPIITANWEEDNDNRWLVPLGGGVGKIFHIGHQPINATLQAYGNVVHPDEGPDWSIRIQFQLLFPK